MYKLPLVVGLIFVSPAFGSTDLVCSPHMEGKQSCRSGLVIRCTRTFDPKSVAIKYVWSVTSASGQALHVDSPLYKKTAGYTPIPCANLNIAKNEIRKSATLN